jgi:hypothetical protein
MGKVRMDSQNEAVGRNGGISRRCDRCKRKYQPEGRYDLFCPKCQSKWLDCAFCGRAFVPRNKQHRKFCKIECERAFRARISSEA